MTLICDIILVSAKLDSIPPLVKVIWRLETVRRQYVYCLGPEDVGPITELYRWASPNPQTGEHMTLKWHLFDCIVIDNNKIKSNYFIKCCKQIYVSLVDILELSNCIWHVNAVNVCLYCYQWRWQQLETMFLILLYQRFDWMMQIFEMNSHIFRTML